MSWSVGVSVRSYVCVCWRWFRNYLPANNDSYALLTQNTGLLSNNSLAADWVMWLQHDLTSTLLVKYVFHIVFICIGVRVWTCMRVYVCHSATAEVICYGITPSPRSSFYRRSSRSTKDHGKGVCLCVGACSCLIGPGSFGENSENSVTRWQVSARSRMSVLIAFVTRCRCLYVLNAAQTN